MKLKGVRVWPDLSGKSPPDARFWIEQGVSLAVLFVALTGIAVLLFLGFLSMRGISLLWLAPLLWFLSHLVSVARAGKHAKTLTGKILCFSYGPILFLALGLSVFWIVKTELRKFRNKAFQAEAKISLAAIYAGQAAHFAETRRYANTIEETGFTPEGADPRYAFALKNCDSNVQFDILIPSGLQGSAETREAIERYFVQLMPTACEGNPHGFVAYAAGNISRGEAKLDVWRIDQTKELNNIVSGL